MKKITFLLLIAISYLSTLQAVPAQVVLLRHAEKPETGDTLSSKGFLRAAALVPLLTTGYFEQLLMPCAAIYGPISSTNHASTRSVQTVSALANAWQVPLYVRFTAGEVEEMVREIVNEPSYNHKMILICWSHSYLPDIAKAFGVSAPPEWPGDSYDRVWIINFNNVLAVSTFQNLPQRVLFGDSDK